MRSLRVHIPGFGLVLSVTGACWLTGVLAANFLGAQLLRWLGQHC